MRFAHRRVILVFTLIVWGCGGTEYPSGNYDGVPCDGIDAPDPADPARCKKGDECIDEFRRLCCG